jgi:hypothetical protein
MTSGRHIAVDMRTAAIVDQTDRSVLML